MIEQASAGQIHRPMTAGVRRDRRAASFEEEILWQNVRDRRMFGLKFRRRHPVNGYVIDFYCISKRLAIELRGSVVDEDGEFDSYKDLTLAGAGVRIIRFTNSEVRYQLPKVLDRIRDACGG